MSCAKLWNAARSVAELERTSRSLSASRAASSGVRRFRKALSRRYLSAAQTSQHGAG